MFSGGFVTPKDVNQHLRWISLDLTGDILRNSLFLFFLNSISSKYKLYKQTKRLRSSLGSASWLSAAWLSSWEQEAAEAEDKSEHVPDSG